MISPHRVRQARRTSEQAARPGITDEAAEDFECGFFPNNIGGTESNNENFFSIGVYPEENTLPFGSTTGKHAILCSTMLPKWEKYSLYLGFMEH